MANTLSDDTLIILIAPNVTEQMGGEGIKALQIFQEIKKIHANTIQITHERNRIELSDRLKLADVYYVADTKLALFLWHSRILSKLLDPWFCYKAVKMAETIAKERGLKRNSVIIHQTEPNSPVIPRTTSKRHANVFGPINGNIYYPPIFRRNEMLSARLRRIFHMPIQRLNRILFRGLTKANFILCAGGARTRDSLLAAGCSPDILVDSPDCGIKDDILAIPRVQHSGTNFRFVHFGSLRFHKCTSFIIESLAKTKNPVCLDIIGKGPELERCQKLTEELNLGHRVRFLDRFTDHRDLILFIRQYRGALLPSIEDANGIVVQESMALGLPMICLDWGGPQLSIENQVSGFLIEPNAKNYIIIKMAEYLDHLSIDGDLAERISLAARERAEIWRWSRVARDWINLYARISRK